MTHCDKSVYLFPKKLYNIQYDQKTSRNGEIYLNDHFTINFSRKSFDHMKKREASDKLRGSQPSAYIHLALYLIKEDKHNLQRESSGAVKN